MTVWVTRAEPGAAATARRLAALGFEPFVAPLLEVRPIPAVVDLAGVGALAFTSANGVRAFADLSPARDLPVFTVGDATAEAAREAGFADVHSARGDVMTLGALLARSAPPGAVLHPGARQLARALPPQVRALAIYETVAVPAPDDLSGVDRVLIHSPRAAGLLADIPGARQLACICISPAAARALGDAFAGPVAVAATPDEDAMLDRLRTWTP